MGRLEMGQEEGGRVSGRASLVGSKDGLVMTILVDW
jgi:hypothetical protein